jgi:hypothetical protein
MICFLHHFAAAFRQRAGEQNCEQVALGVSSQNATGCATSLSQLELSDVQVAKVCKFAFQDT